MKSPSDSMVTEPPSFVANVPGTTVSEPGPSTSTSPARMSPVMLFLGLESVGAPSDGSFTTRDVLPIAPLAPSKVSSSATGASGTHVTVTETVAVEPPLRV
jgi:hypothetical protein